MRVFSTDWIERYYFCRVLAVPRHGQNLYRVHLTFPVPNTNPSVQTLVVHVYMMYVYFLDFIFTGGEERASTATPVWGDTS